MLYLRVEANLGVKIFVEYSTPRKINVIWMILEKIDV